jgi:hypothetical protein
MQESRETLSRKEVTAETEQGSWREGGLESSLGGATVSRAKYHFKEKRLSNYRLAVSWCGCAQIKWGTFPEIISPEGDGICRRQRLLGFEHQDVPLIQMSGVQSRQ